MAAYSYKLSNILISVRSLLRETTASFWSDAILTIYINEAIRTIAQRVGAYRTISTAYSTAALTRTVAFAGYKCLAVEYNNKALIKITPLQLGHVRLDGILPQYWFEYGNYIGIEPIPADIYPLTMYLASIPTALSGVNDVPVIPYSLCGLITPFAASRALEQDNKKDVATELMGMFDNDLEFLSQALLPNIPNGVEDMRFA